MKKITKKEINHKVKDAVNLAIEQLDMAPPSKKTKKVVEKATKKISDKLNKQIKKNTQKEKKLAKDLTKKNGKASKKIQPTPGGIEKV